jgi:hypothetical protein
MKSKNTVTQKTTGQRKRESHHMGIPGNEITDEETKARRRPLSHRIIPTTRSD